MAQEVGEYDINVNAVCPGSVEAPRIEDASKRYAEARGTYSEIVKQGEMKISARVKLVKSESVAHLVGFLCSPESGQTTGQDLNVSAGKIVY